MASLAHHPAWLILGLGLWAGCELVSGVDGLKVGGAGGGVGHGGSGGDITSGNVSTGRQHGATNGVGGQTGTSDGGFGGSGGNAIAVGQSSSTLASSANVTNGVSSSTTGGSTVSSGPGVGSSTTGVGPGSSSSTVMCVPLCGDGFCDMPCENAMTCPQDCGGGVSGSSGVGSGMDFPFR